MLLTAQEGSDYVCVEGWDEAKSEKHEHDKMVEKAETDEGWVRVDTALDQLRKSRKNGPVDASQVDIEIIIKESFSKDNPRFESKKMNGHCWVRAFNLHYFRTRRKQHTTNCNAGSSGIYGNVASEPAVNTSWNQLHEISTTTDPSIARHIRVWGVSILCVATTYSDCGMVQAIALHHLLVPAPVESAGRYMEPKRGSGPRCFPRTGIAVWGMRCSSRLRTLLGLGES